MTYVPTLANEAWRKVKSHGKWNYWKRMLVFGPLVYHKWPKLSTYHSQNKLVVKSEEQREEKVGSEPCELDGTGDRVLVLKVIVLGRLGSASVALDIELALDITLSLLGGEERKRLLVIGTGRHGDGCAGDSWGCDQVPLTNVEVIVGSLA